MIKKIPTINKQKINYFFFFNLLTGRALFPIRKYQTKWIWTSTQLALIQTANTFALEGKNKFSIILKTKQASNVNIYIDLASVASIAKWPWERIKENHHPIFHTKSDNLHNSISSTYNDTEWKILFDINDNETWDMMWPLASHIFFFTSFMF